MCFQARCYEEENEYLERLIAEEMSLEPIPSSVTLAVEKPRYSLDGVVERLRRQKVEFSFFTFSLFWSVWNDPSLPSQDEVLHDTEELKAELERLLKEYEEAAHQRTLVQQDQQAVSEVSALFVFS